MNGTGPDEKGAKTGRGLGKCSEVSKNEAVEKLGKGMGMLRQSGGGQGHGMRLKSGLK